MSLTLVPSYGMRYLAKVLKATLAEKFPDAGEAELYKASADPPRPTPRRTETLCGEPRRKASPTLRLVLAHQQGLGSRRGQRGRS